MREDRSRTVLLPLSSLLIRLPFAESAIDRRFSIKRSPIHTKTVKVPRMKATT